MFDRTSATTSSGTTLKYIAYHDLIVQYLRMLTNSLIAGALAGAYVAVLVLQLNPTFTLNSFAVVRLMLIWWAFYSVLAAALFYSLIVLRQLVAVEVQSPGWVSLWLLAVFGTIAIAASGTLTWLNLDGFRSVLGPDAAARMLQGAVVLTICAVTCAALALIQWRRESHRRVTAAIFAVSLVTSLVLPLYLRGRGESSRVRNARGTPQIVQVPSDARVLMILLDGASLDFITPNAAGGRLPNFGRLLENGAVTHLATLRPTQPAPVWTAVATGKLPYKTAVYSAARYVVPGSDQRLDLLPDFCFAQAMVRLGLLETEERASDAVRARPIWELLSGYGVRSGVINWPLTYPAHGVDGYLISDEFLDRHSRSVVAALRDEPLLAYPPEVLEEARSVQMRTIGVTSPAAAPAPQTIASGALALDAAVDDLARQFREMRPVQFSAVRYPGIDAVAHYYLRYAMPREFGDVSDLERQQHGRVLEQYYAHLDAIIGESLQTAGPDDLLLVVSGFGIEPLSLGKRVLERLIGDPEVSGSHESAPDGFMIAYGGPVAKGSLPRASVLDVAPTVLYFLGLPIARDLDGFARTDVFARTFTERRPITFIPDYDR